MQATPSTFYVSELAYGHGYVVKVNGRVVAGPFRHKGMALAEANLLASAKPGNRVES